MIPSKRLPQNPADYQSVPDDPADWAHVMQQWTKIRDSVPNNNKKTDLPKSPQSLESDKSNIVELPTFLQILKPVKSEVVELPTSLQMLETVKSVVTELPTSLQILEPVKSERVGASLNGTDCKDAFINVVADVHCSNNSKEIQLLSRSRKKANKKEKKKRKKLKAKRSRGLKSNGVFSNDIQRDNAGNSVSNNFGRLSKGAKKSRFSSAFAHQSQLLTNPISKSYSSQQNVIGISKIRKTKDEIMEEAMLKVRQTLTTLLLETTENQVLTIAKEELKRAKSIARSVRNSFSFLSSLSGKLGLKIDDSDNSDNSEKQRNEMNQLESDEELQVLIDQRQRNFEKIEMQIDLEIESRTEKEKSIAYQNDTREKCIMKNDLEKNKVDENRHLESTSHHCTNEINSKITNKVVPKSRNLTVSSCNKPKNQHYQTNCQQKNYNQSTIKRNSVIQNLKSIESTRENLSSSSSTLSPSSLSSTTSWSSESRNSPRASYYHSFRSDSDSNSDSPTRRKSKINRTSSKTQPYSRHYKSPSKKKTVHSPPNRCSSSRRNELSTRHSSPYRRGDSPSQFRSRRSLSRSRRRQKSSDRAYSMRYRCSSDSSESRRSSYEQARR